MLQWRVHEVMTRDVVTVSEEASMADIAAVLTDRRVSGVPVVDRYDVVVGVVTWTDILRSVEFSAPGSNRRRDRQPSWRRPRDTAVQLMSAAPVTINPDASLATAARTMHRRNLSRLLVVDARHRLLGIVTRRDLLAPFSRLDAVIEDDIRQRVLHRTLRIEANSVQVRVDDGVATLTGRTARRTIAQAAVALTQAVPGVADVRDHLLFDENDTAPAPPERTDAPDAIRGWLRPASA